MLIRPRKVKRSGKFTPRWVMTARKRKEQAVSLYSTALIQLVLFFFLVLGAYKSYLAITARASDLGVVQRAAVPAFFILAAIFILRSCIRNYMEARSVRNTSPDGEGL